MARHLLCLVGVHRWVELRNADGEAYVECSRCGQYREPEHWGGGHPVGGPGGG